MRCASMYARNSYPPSPDPPQFRSCANWAPRSRSACEGKTMIIISSYIMSCVRPTDISDDAMVCRDPKTVRDEGISRRHVQATRPRQSQFSSLPPPQILISANEHNRGITGISAYAIMRGEGVTEVQVPPSPTRGTPNNITNGRGNPGAVTSNGVKDRLDTFTVSEAKQRPILTPHII